MSGFIHSIKSGKKYSPSKSIMPSAYPAQSFYDEEKFWEFLDEFSSNYPGSKCKLLRFLVYDHLPIYELSDDNSGFCLLIHLHRRNYISYTNVTILSEIADVTGCHSAIKCVEKYKETIPHSSETSEGLLQYRKLVFRALQEISSDDLKKIVAFYDLAFREFLDVYDIVFHMETHGFLSAKKESWKKFGKFLSGKAEHLLKEAVKLFPQPATLGETLLPTTIDYYRSETEETPSILKKQVTEDPSTVARHSLEERFIPGEIIAHGAAAVETFVDALNEANVEVAGRLIVMGLERVGKTSTIRSLLKKEFNPDEPITDAIVTNKIYIHDSSNEWTEAEEDKFSVAYKQKVAELIAEEVLTKPNVSEILQAETEICQLSSTVSLVPEHIDRRVEKMKVSNETFIEWKSSTNEFIMDIWDFGGQPIYNTIQQIFIPSLAVVSVVFNLEHDLNQSARVRDSRTGEIFEHKMTYIDYILYSIRLVYMNSRHRDLDGILAPPVLLIGTHCESSVLGCTQEERSSEIERKCTKIWEALKDKPYQKMVFSKIFTIENSVPFGKSNAAEIMKEIQTLSKKMARRLPLKWVLVQTEIQKLEKKDICLQAREIIDLMKQCGIKQDMQEVLLGYLHDVGEIICYRSVRALKDNIVVDFKRVAVLAKAILVVLDPENQQPELRSDFQRLDSGILSERLLRHLWDKLGVRDELFDFFVCLLLKFGLIWEKKSTKGTEREFIVLSRLKPIPTTFQIEEYGRRAISLYHDFNNYLPDDIFQHAATKFIDRFQMENVEPKLQYEHVELNVDENHFVILEVDNIKQRRMFKTTIIRTRIPSTESTEEEPEPNMCKKVLNFLNYELATLCPSDEKNVEMKMYIPCECCTNNHWHVVKNFDKNVLPCGTKKMDVTRYCRLFGHDSLIPNEDWQEKTGPQMTTKLKIPSEIIAMGKFAVNSYQHELEMRKTTMVNSRILFLGNEGVGKTSCVNNILGKRFNQYEPSTNETMTTNVVEWKEQNVGTIITKKIAHEQIPSVYQKAVDKIQFGSTVKSQRGMTSISDSAGFLKYFTSQRFFLTSRSSYNIVFNLLEKLDDVANNSLSGVSEMTNKQIILFYLRTIYEHTVLHSTEKIKLLNEKFTLPMITLVATHKDKMLGSEAEKKMEIENVSTSIFNGIKDKPYEMYVDRELLAVDNTNPLDEGIQMLKKRMNNYINVTTETVPTCWVDFQSMIQAVGRTKLYLPLVEITSIAGGCGISERNIILALAYLSNVGVIFRSNDTVITNLDMMVSMMTRIITGTKTEKVLSSLMDSWKQFDYDGILEEKLLHHLWEPEIKEDSSNLDVSLKVMEMFGLIFEKRVHQEERVFVVPSRIRAKTNDLEIVKDQKQTASIYVTPLDILPDAVKDVLVVGFLKLMEVKGRNTKSVVLYQNCNEFDLYDDHLVKLGAVEYENRHALKLEITHKNVVAKDIGEPDRSVCMEILAYLRVQLKTVYGTIEGVGYELQVCCNACHFKDRPHLHKLDESVKNGWVKCGSRLIETFRLMHLFATDLSVKEFDFRGGMLEINDIKLIITQNAIERGKTVKIYLGNIMSDKILSLDKETRLSPIVYCGPNGTVFNQGCLLSFPHNILDEKCWKLAGIVRHKPGEPWRKITFEDKYYKCHAKNGRCFIELRHFCWFSFGGKPKIDGPTQVVNMEVSNSWNQFNPNICEIYVKTFGANENNSHGSCYSYVLTEDPLSISFDNVPKGWKVTPRKEDVDGKLVWKHYACRFYLEPHDTTGCSYFGTIKIKQNCSYKTPFYKVPYTKNSQGHVRQQLDTRHTPDIIERPEFNTLCFKLGKLYTGQNYKYLRFLLCDDLSFGQLPQEDANCKALTLFNRLAERGVISNDNIIILSEIAQVTNIKEAKDYIESYEQNWSCKKGTILKPYRKTLFRALMEVIHDEIGTITAYYKLDDDDIWDLVFKLENKKCLEDTKQKWEEFAALLNARARDIMIYELPSIGNAELVARIGANEFSDTRSVRNEAHAINETTIVKAVSWVLIPMFALLYIYTMLKL